MGKEKKKTSIIYSPVLRGEMFLKDLRAGLFHNESEGDFCCQAPRRTKKQSQVFLSHTTALCEELKCNLSHYELTQGWVNSKRILFLGRGKQ